MSVDAELLKWRLAWHAQPAVTQSPRLDVARLRAQVMRDTRRQQLSLIPPALLTLVFGGGSLWHAWASPGTMTLAYAVSIWVFLATAWIGSTLLARGTWRPQGESTAAFLDVTVRRYRSMLRTVPFAVALYAAELAFFLWLPVQVGGVEPRDALTRWPAIILGWLGLPVFIGAMVWWRQRTLRQLHYWIGLRQQLLAP